MTKRVEVNSGPFDMSVDYSRKPNEVKHGTLNIWTATLFVAGENAGAALLALPFALRGASWWGLIIIVLFGVDAAYAGVILARCWTLIEERWPEFRGTVRYPYPAIGLMAFGPKIRILVSICMNVTCLGSCVVVLLLCTELVSNVLTEHTGICFCYWVLIIAALLCPLMWFGTPKEFWPIAAAALGLTVVTVGLLIWDMIKDYKELETKAEYESPTFSSVFLAFGTVTFAYGATCSFPTFQNDMKEKSQFKYSVLIGFAILLAIYLPTAIMGYITYRGSVQNDVFLSLLHQSTRTTIAQLLLSGHLFFAFLILANSPAQEIEELLSFPNKFGIKRVSFRVFLLVMIVFVGESIPNFGKILNLIGGSTVTMCSYILPPVCYLKLCSQSDPNGNWSKKSIPLLEKCFLYQIIIIGAAAGIACTYSAIYDIVGPHALTQPCYMNSSYAPANK